ncbi:MAG: C40 family peptidase [Candidatus Kapaibacterium sp.]|nr:C40 family peptidase [Bacteroidota bacterium]
MLSRIYNISFFGMFLVLLASLVILPSAEGIAAKKKSSYSKKIRGKKKSKRFRSHVACQPTLGKVQALEMLRTDGTNELQQLAGLGIGNGDNINIESAPDIIQKQLQQEGENLSELEKEDDVQVDIESFKMLWLSYLDPENDATPNKGDGKSEPGSLLSGISKQQMMNAVMDWVGTRYHFGGTSRSGIDCSAFTRAVFAQSGNVVLPRTAQSQIQVGMPVERVSDLQFGDLIFFHTMSHAYVSHVGIYLGNNLFAHSSSRYGVTISSLESSYYNARLIGARRLTKSDVAQLSNGAGEVLTTK